MASRHSARNHDRVDLPSLPVALARILDATNSPEATAEDVAGAILLDQSLATKILRMANSAYYGRLTKAETVSQAVVTLGFAAIKNVAIASSVVDNLFPKNAVRGFGWREFWVHCVTCGAAAEILWGYMGGAQSQSETAFVAGLLHDVGKLIIARALPARFIDVISCCEIQKCEMIQAENAVLYTTHAHVGLDLCKQWNFPETLCYGIAYHHNKGDNANLPIVAKAVRAGDMLARAVAPNYLLDAECEVSLDDVATLAKLTPTQLNSALYLVELKMAQCEELLSWGEDLPGSASPSKAA